MGISEVEQFKQFHVFPNPSQGVVTLAIDAPLASAMTISVMNVLGQRVFTKTGSSASLSHSTLDLSQLDKGIYLLEVFELKNQFKFFIWINLLLDK